MKNQKIPWFVSPAGRRFSKGVVFATTCGGFLMYCLPNTLFVDQFRSVTQSYKKGIAVKVSDRIPPLVKEVMNDSKMCQEKQDLISLYTSYGIDLFHAGVLPLKSKCVLGIPSNFKCKDVNEFDHAGMTVNNEPVKWNLPEAHSLRDSLIFSDDAKKFAIAREIANLNTIEPISNGICTSVVLSMCYSLSSTVNARLNMLAKARFFRLVWYGLTVTFSYMTWILLKDFSCVSYETDADMAAASISESYARGGLEYYEKILKRNIALRALMGDKGETRYTAYGNDQALFRVKHLPFTTRRDMMKDKIKIFEEARDENSPTETETKGVAHEENRPTKTETKGVAHEENRPIKTETEEVAHEETRPMKTETKDSTKEST